jgi:hypothetical protein
MSTLAEGDAGVGPAQVKETGRGGSIVGLLRSTFESLLLLSLLLAVEALFFGSGYFASLSIHPFWIVVLLASVQNGLFAGVVTTALAASLMDWPPRPIGVDITTHYLATAILPLQWLIVSFCIGFYREGQIRAERQLVTANARLTQINEALASEIARLDQTIRAQELAASTARQQQSNVGEALGKIVALSQATGEELQVRFGEAAAKLTKESSVLLLAPDQKADADKSGGAPVKELEVLLGDHGFLSRLNDADSALLVAPGGTEEPARQFAVRAFQTRSTAAGAGIVAVAVGEHGGAIAALITEILAHAARLALSCTSFAALEEVDA